MMMKVFSYSLIHGDYGNRGGNWTSSPPMMSIESQGFPLSYQVFFHTVGRYGATVVGKGKVTGPTGVG